MVMNVGMLKAPYRADRLCEEISLPSLSAQAREAPGLRLVTMGWVCPALWAMWIWVA
jgi:hypothetical protein